MTSSARWAFAAASLAVVAAATAAVVFWLAPRWDAGEGGTFGVRALRVATSVDPQAALVGDQLSARASVLVDSRTIDPATVRLAARFAPFGLVGTRRVVHDDVGRAALVEVTYTLQCVTVDCLYAMERVEEGRTLSRPIALPAGTLTARTRDGRRESAAFRWPRVNLRSRLDQAAVDLLETRPASFRRPDVSYHVRPSVLGWGATAAAAALLLLGAWLLAGVIRGAPAVRLLRIPGHLSGVQRALALLEHAREANDVAGERRALERLAHELDRTGHVELAVTASRLAWSRNGPRDDALERFATICADEVDGR